MCVCVCTWMKRVLQTRTYKTTVVGVSPSSIAAAAVADIADVIRSPSSVVAYTRTAAGNDTPAAPQTSLTDIGAYGP